MKKPGDCTSIEEVRKGIDDIDNQVIALLGERLAYIRQIVKFKKNEEDIRAKKRYDEVLQARRNWAQHHHLDPDVIESIYKILMQYFIEVQKEDLRRILASDKRA